MFRIYDFLGLDRVTVGRIIYINGWYEMLLKEYKWLMNNVSDKTFEWRSVDEVKWYNWAHYYDSKNETICGCEKLRELRNLIDVYTDFDTCNARRFMKELLRCCWKCDRIDNRMRRYPL